MTKNIMISLGIGVVVLGGAAVFTLGGGGGTEQTPVGSAGSDCAEVCATAQEACPSLIDKATCEAGCETMSEETKEHLRTAGSCEELTAKPELMSEVVIPTMGDASDYEEKAVASQDCEAACGHYVSGCLTLVPNASEALFDDGYRSCLDECAGWNGDKVECMITAFDCEAMTNVCGL